MNMCFRGAFVTLVFLPLVGCGGGGTGDSPNPTGRLNSTTATAQGIPQVSYDDEILIVSLKYPSSVTDPSLSRREIVIADKNNNPVSLSYVSNGALKYVTTIDELPQGLEQYPWVRNKSATHNLRIQFKAGDYEMNTGWQWGSALSGHKVGLSDYYIIMEAYGSDDVVFVGSKRFVASLAGSNFVVNMTGVTPFDQLWAKQSGRLVRARQPNLGSYYYVDQPWLGGPDGNGNPTTNIGFKPYTQDSVNFTKALASPQSEVVLFGDDFVTRHPISALDSSGRMALLQPSPVPVPNAFPIQAGSRYFLENYAEALDAPREWYFKSNGTNAGTLTYIPEAGQTTLQFEVPQVATLITMAGAINGDAVQDVKFGHLKFRYTKGPQTDGVGSVFQQAAYTDPSAIDVSFANNIEFSYCEISHTGGNGVRFNRQVSSSFLDYSEIFDIGAGGVLAGANPDLDKSASLESEDFSEGKLTKNIYVQGNLIHNVGARNPSGHGIWFGHVQNGWIRSNLIKDVIQSGISVGWWGASAEKYPDVQANNIISDNYLYNIGAAGLSDLGGIYTLAYSPGTRVTGNVVRNVRAYDGGGRGVYLDEYSSGVRVDSNYLIDIDSKGIGQHFGYNNIVENNVISASSAFFIQQRDPVHSNTIPLTVQQNWFFPTSSIVVPSDDPSLMANGAWVGTASTGVSVSGNVVSLTNIPWLSLSTDYVFKAQCDCNENAQMALNAGPFPAVPTLTGASVSADFMPQGEFDGLVLSAVPLPSYAMWAGNWSDEPNRVDLQSASNNVRIGSQQNAAYWGVTNVGQFAVVRESNNAEYLTMTDSQGNPKPILELGRSTLPGNKVTVSFRARFDANARITHAWRKSSNDFQIVGPRVDFDGGGSDGLVHVMAPDGSEIATIPVNTWTTITISQVQSTGSTWTISVQADGGNAVQKSYNSASPTFVNASDFLFTSNANLVGGATSSVSSFRYLTTKVE